MQAEVSSYAVDLLLTVAGFGVLLAVGLKPRGGLGALGAVGLAYITGSAVVPLVLTILLIVGIPFQLLTFFLVVAACMLLGAWRAGGSIAPPGRVRLAELRRWRAWRPESWIVVVFVVAFGVYAVAGFLNAFHLPLVEWDGWAIWGRKAQVLTDHASLWPSFFKNSAYYSAHLDYPILFPVWEAIHSRAAGVFDTTEILGHVWLWVVGLIWGLAYLVHVHVRVRPLVWAPVLLLLATAPAIWQQASGDADLPMAIFVAFGAISIGVWLGGGDRRSLALGAIMLAAAANTKNEGTAAALVVMAVAGAIVLARKLDLRAWAVAATGTVVVGILPWHAWLAAQHIESDLPLSKGIDPAYLAGRTSRIGPSISALVAQMAEQSRWVYLVPLGALCVAFALVSGLGRRIAAFYLGAFLVLSAIFVWIYWIGPYELNWYLGTSVPRVVSVLMLLSAVAILHLCGAFVAALIGGGEAGERRR